MRDEWHLYFILLLYNINTYTAYLMIFLVSEISFSTNGMDYLSREEAPEEETARIEGSGREEKANQPGELGERGEGQT